MANKKTEEKKTIGDVVDDVIRQDRFPSGDLEDFQERGAAAQRAVDAVAVAPQPPSIGRIVIYTSAGEKGFMGEQHPALITGVDADTVALRVFTRTTEFVVPAARFTDEAPGGEHAQGRWAWPPRV